MHAHTHLFTGAYSLRVKLLRYFPQDSQTFSTVSYGMAILLNSKYIYNTFQISLLQLLKAAVNGYHYPCLE